VNPKLPDSTLASISKLTLLLSITLSIHTSSPSFSSRELLISNVLPQLFETYLVLSPLTPLLHPNELDASNITAKTIIIFFIYYCFHLQNLYHASM